MHFERSKTFSYGHLTTKAYKKSWFCFITYALEFLGTHLSFLGFVSFRAWHSSIEIWKQFADISLPKEMHSVNATNSTFCGKTCVNSVQHCLNLNTTARSKSKFAHHQSKLLQCYLVASLAWTSLRVRRAGSVRLSVIAVECRE